MFSNLKHKNPKTSTFKNSPKYPESYHRSPGATTSNIKPDEADRLVRCKICGFICDRDRDMSLPYGSWAGNGISYSPAATAGTSVGDAMVPAAGTGTKKADT